MAIDCRQASRIEPIIIKFNFPNEIRNNKQKMEDEMFSLKLKKGLAQRERTVQNFIENDTL